MHQYFLVLNEEIPNPAYRERAFSIEIEIIDRDGGRVALTNNETFRLKIFTNDKPPVVLENNTNGDKIIRGNVRVEGTSKICFKKIFINEVTSKYRNGDVFLVVVPDNFSVIRPLVIPNFVIKAKKTASGNISKRLHLE